MVLVIKPRGVFEGLLGQREATELFHHRLQRRAKPHATGDSQPGLSIERNERGDKKNDEQFRWKKKGNRKAVRSCKEKVRTLLVDT